MTNSINQSEETQNKKSVPHLLVVGSGIAGLMTALHASRFCEVTIVTKGDLQSGSTLHAQGGIAFAIGVDDSNDLHIKDTLRAGVGFCDLGLCI